MMELRVKGVSWVNLAIIFETTTRTIKRHISHAEEHGFSLWK